MPDEKMYDAVPTQTVVVSRPTDAKDKDGKPVFKRFVPPIGKPFSFTESELKDIQRLSPAAIRDPRGGTVDFEESVDQGAAAAAAAAVQAGTAVSDAVNVAKGAKGPHKGKMPKSVSSAPEDHTDDEDDL